MIQAISTINDGLVLTGKNKCWPPPCLSFASGSAPGQPVYLRDDFHSYRCAVGLPSVTLAQSPEWNPRVVTRHPTGTHFQLNGSKHQLFLVESPSWLSCGNTHPSRHPSLENEQDPRLPHTPLSIWSQSPKLVDFIS